MTTAKKSKGKRKRIVMQIEMKARAKKLQQGENKLNEKKISKYPKAQ